MQKPSEDDFQGQLANASGISLGEHSAGIPSGIGWRNRVEEIDLVEQIEGFHPELQLNAFADLELLEKREVYVGIAGAEDGVSGRVAIVSSPCRWGGTGRIHERRRVEPVVGRSLTLRQVAIIDRTRHQGGAHVA